MCRNRKYDDNVDNETVKTSEEIFRPIISYTLLIMLLHHFKVDLSSLEYMKGIFSFIFNIENLKSLDDSKLIDSCLNLESSLNHNNCSDIDAIDLFSELRVLREIII